MINVAELVQQMVRIPSVNPMGQDVDGDIYFETRMSEFLTKLLGELGFQVESQIIEPGRTNLVARFAPPDPTSARRPVILFEAHQDTVPVEGMTIDPWGGELRDGRIFGRGACDIKGGLGCIIAAAERLKSAGSLPVQIVLAFTVNEESGHSGAAQLRDAWSDGVLKLLPEPPDAIVVAEPTELNTVVAHKGVLRWKCETLGRAAHSSSPVEGDNAVYSMARVLSAIQCEAERVSRLGAHPLVGAPTMNVGLIRGGVSVNTVPDRCVIDVERRLVPGESPEIAYETSVAEINRLSLPGKPPHHHPPNMATPGLADDRNGALAEAMLAAATRVEVPAARVGVPFCTDASSLSVSGIPAIVFGPGSIRQAHTADEWISVEQLEKAVEILCQFAEHGLAGC
jgi:acetylornithine deacetylase